MHLDAALRPVKGKAVLLVAVLIAVAAVAVVVCRSTGHVQTAAQQQALVVDGRVVAPEELKTYGQAHSIDLSTDVGLQSAVTGLVRFKVLQQQAFDRGLIGYLDYAGFLDDLQIKNSAMQQAISAGQAVYGVSHYEPSTYLSYVESNLQHAVQQALINEKRINPSDSALRTFYGKHKDLYAKKVDSISLTLSRPPATGQGAGVPVENLTIDDKNAYSYSKYRPALYAVALQLTAGQIQPVVGDTDGEQLLARCTSRKSAGYKTFQEVREEITQRYEDEQFQRYLDSLTTAAKVVVNQRLRDLMP
jgi:hypothetical protein